MQHSQEHLKTMVYAKFGGQTECIMGNWKIENYSKKGCTGPHWGGANVLEFSSHSFLKNLIIWGVLNMFPNLSLSLLINPRKTETSPKKHSHY